jgi:hypothetical protein
MSNLINLARASALHLIESSFLQSVGEAFSLWRTTAPGIPRISGHTVIYSRRWSRTRIAFSDDLLTPELQCPPWASIVDNSTHAAATAVRSISAVHFPS